MVIKERNLLSYILLSVVTCGIYSIYWWWVYVKDINEVCKGDGKESPNYIVVMLLSIITCGIYAFVWLYKQGNRLQEIAPKYGLSFTENGTSVLVWTIFGSLLCGIGPFIATNILIKNLNAIGAVYNSQLS